MRLENELPATSEDSAIHSARFRSPLTPRYGTFTPKEPEDHLDGPGRTLKFEQGQLYASNEDSLGDENTGSYAEIIDRGS